MLGQLLLSLLKGGCNMPVKSSKELVPFVNDLEVKLLAMKPDVDIWSSNKTKVLNAVPQVDRNKQSALTALVKAEDALAELNSATFGVQAVKGQKLKKVLDDIQNVLNAFATGGVGGGGTQVESRFTQELDNAISAVDSVMEDGLKLDYRLRQIQKIGQEGLDLSSTAMAKEFIIPQKYQVYSFSSQLLEIPQTDGTEFVDGTVTVLSEDGTHALLNERDEAITGTITMTGMITLSDIPQEPATLYYPVRMAYKDLPEDVLYYLIQTVVEKTNPMIIKIQIYEKLINEIWDELAKMKGNNWTVDHSIMHNHIDIVKESITPKGLSVEIQDGIVHCSFSYNDHPLLSHFILEKWDENLRDWIPFDGDQGVVAK
jgi:hypothetical protein